VKFVDIETAITTLESYAEYVRAIRATAIQLIHQREMGPETLARIACLKNHLEKTFAAGINISETLLEDIPRLLACPAQLASALEAQSRLGEESDQIMIILAQVDPALMNTNATLH
jgi:hypothetical protein